MSDEFIRDLRQLIARRQAIAVVGCGVSIGATRGSRLAGLASWGGLLQDGLRQCVALRRATEAWAAVVRAEIKLGLTMPGETDLLVSAAEKISRKLGAPDDGEFSRWLRSTVGTLEVCDSRVIKALHALKIPIATTNYDSLLEHVTGLRPITWKEGRRAERFLRGEDAGILHLHGYWEQPDTVILGTRSYSEILRDEHAQAIQRVMSSLNCLLFVGCGDGLEDSNIGELIRWHGQVFHSSEYRHYRLALAEEAERFQERHPPSQRVVVISYGRQHSDLAPFLERLSDGERYATTENPQRSIVNIFREALFPGLDEDLKHAHDLLKENKYEEAVSNLKEVLTRLEETAQINERDLDLEKRISKCRFMLGGALLCLQMKEEAHLVWQQVNPSDISDQARIEFARGLAQIGDISRAEALLPQGSTEDAVEDTRKLIALCKNEIPSIPPKEPSIKILACFLLVERGYFEDAAKLALEALIAAKEKSDPLHEGNAAGVLFAALQGTILEHSNIKQPIPTALRESVVVSIVDLLIKLTDEARIVPVPMRIAALKLAATFFTFTMDLYRAHQAGEALRELGESLPASEEPSLAASGKLEEALQLISQDTHPWIGRFKKAKLLSIAGKFEEAGQEFLAISKQFPARAPVEYHCASILNQRQRFQEALPHAQEAYAQLPCLGYCLLLAQTLIVNEQAKTAWELLQQLRDSNDPAVLRTLAFAAFHAKRPGQETLDLSARYLSVAPMDVRFRIEYALQLSRLGEQSKARDEAWQAIHAAKIESLDIQSLHIAASLQRISEQPDDITHERSRHIAQILKTRFPRDPKAESIRFQLLAGLGFPEKDQIDFSLMEQAGLVWAVSQDEVLSTLLKQHQRHQEMAAAALRLYRIGFMSLETLCELTKVTPPLYLSRVIHINGEQVFLCPPPSHSPESTLNLSGAELLVGEMELVLLHHLGLLGPLRDALGPQGRLYLFQDVELSVRNETTPTLWQQQSRRDQLKEKDALWDLLFSEDKILIEKGQPAARDQDIARERGYGIVSIDAPSSPSNYLAPRSLIDWLSHNGSIPVEVMRRAKEGLPRLSTPIEKMPTTLYIDLTILELLHKEKILSNLLRVLPGKLWVGPETLWKLRNERDDSKISLEASERSLAINTFLSAGIREGWLVSLERHEPDLPSLVDPQLQPVEKSLRRALAYRLALESAPTRYLLTMDFLVAAPFTPSAPPSLMSLFRWNKQTYTALKTRLDQVAERVLHLPELLKTFNLAESRLHQVRCDLAELGFVDALTPADLRQLVRNYQNLKGEYPKRLLDRAEWMAREREHPGALSSRLQTAQLYSEALWAAWTALAPAQEREPLTLGILERMEILEERSPGAFDELFWAIAVLASDRPRLSFVAEGAGEKEPHEWLRPTLESRAGQLWTYLNLWAGDGKRRAAMLRGIHRLLCSLDEIYGSEGPPSEQLAPLFIALTAAEPDSAPSTDVANNKIHLSFNDMTFGILAVLSSGWKFQPLSGVEIDLIEQRSGKTSRVNLQHVIEYGVRQLENGMTYGSESRDFLFLFPLHEGHTGVTVEIMPEALVLRSSREIRVNHAARLTKWYAAYDGILSQLWHQLSENPDDIALQHQIARRAVLAPFRQVRADAGLMHQWLLPASPPLVSELRQMLNEPDHLSDGPIWNTLIENQSRGSDVLRQSVEIPGPLPGLAIGARLAERGYAFEVAEALRHLEEAQSQPIGRICGDILFLRLAAASKPIVPLAQGEVDLREELPERLVRLVRLSMDEPALDTLAAAEAAMLRLCAHIVEIKALPQQLSLKEGLWLTYRLYQWLSSQIGILSPDARRSALISLQRNAPSANPEEKCGPDILNPFRFDRNRFDHRLATVLYSLRLMEDYGLRRITLASDDDSNERVENDGTQADLRSVSSPGLEALLIELASREQVEEGTRELLLQPSELGWNASASVPELALAALLALNSEAFLRLSESSRMSWLLKLPNSVTHPSLLHSDTVRLLISAAGVHTRGLSFPERIALLERIHFLRNTFSSDDWLRHTWLALIGLFGAGHLELDQEIQALLSTNVHHEMAPIAFATYLVALSFVAPGRMEEALLQMLLNLQAANIPAFPFISGLGRVLFMGSQEGAVHARELLRRLSTDPRFVKDSDLRRLIKLLNL